MSGVQSIWRLQFNMITIEQSKAGSYPIARELISEGPSKGTVVLFTGPHSGIVISRPTGGIYPVGHYDKNWISNNIINEWRPVVVTIEG